MSVFDKTYRKWLPALFAALGLAAACRSISLAQPSAPAAAPPRPASFRACAMCHEVTANAPDSCGPNLLGVVGRKAGTLSGYDYSVKMRTSNIVWTADVIQAYIRHPNQVLPGTAMDYQGASEADAKEITEYLVSLK